VEAELRQALANVARLLEGEGLALADVVKATVFMVDIADYTVMNRIWLDTFGDNRPTRSAVAVAALPMGAKVEVEAWAYRPEPGQSPAAGVGRAPIQPA
jgi:2-iminobutanoate/2-iminopropanoate deaminase